MSSSSHYVPFHLPPPPPPPPQLCQEYRGSSGHGPCICLPGTKRFLLSLTGLPQALEAVGPADTEE
eukprot:130985-Hanusia_phi.AAC.1